MSETCTKDCSTCGSDCGQRREAQSFLKAPNQQSSIKKVIAVMSGKGGVGKSMVTTLLACAMRRKGYRVAILDADVTGPSIPAGLGIHGNAVGIDDSIYPSASVSGIEVMSMNLLLEAESDPVVWRGPVIAGAVGQFWTDVIWGDVDYMFVDMPPGTGDVPLTVFQTLPVDGIVVVTSPQELVGVIVEKAVKMAGLMDKPIVGLVENMASFTCPDCGKRHRIFGESHLQELAAAYHIPVAVEAPIEPRLAKAADEGKLEFVSADWLQPLVDSLG